MPEKKNTGSQLVQTRRGDRKSQKNTEKFKDAKKFIIQLVVYIQVNFSIYSQLSNVF